LLEIGYERLDQEMELTKMIKTLRDVQILLKDFHQFPEISEKIKNNQIKIIDLDNSSSGKDKN
jgi:hypothetical protein